MAIAHDASTTDQFGGGHSSRTFAHTVSGSDLILFVKVGCYQNAGQTVTGITYNGVALTKVDAQNQGTNTIRAELWYLVAPATGANNVIVTWSAAVASASYCATSYTGVNQTTPLGTSAKTSGTGTAVSLAVSSATGEVVVDSLAWRRDGSPTMTVGGSQTQRHNVLVSAGSSFNGGASSDQPGATTTTMAWTMSGTNHSWAIVAVPVKPVSGTTFTTTLSSGTTGSAGVTDRPGCGVAASTSASASLTRHAAVARAAANAAAAALVRAVAVTRSSSTTGTAGVTDRRDAAVSASTTATPTLARRTNLTRAAASTALAAVTHGLATLRTLTAGTTGSAGLLNRPTISRSATTTAAAHTQSVGARLAEIAASTAASPVIVRGARKSLAATTTAAVVVARRTSRAVAAAQAIAVAISRRPSRTTAASAPLAVTITNRVAIARSAAAVAAAAFRRISSTHLHAPADLDADVDRQQALHVAIAAASTATTRVEKAIALTRSVATIATAGVRRVTQLVIRGVVTGLASLMPHTGRPTTSEYRPRIRSARAGSSTGLSAGTVRAPSAGDDDSPAAGGAGTILGPSAGDIP